jgi:hypothetical protein
VAVLSTRRCAVDTRIATVALAAILALASMPMVCGWVVADSHYALSADICHPLQSLDVGSAPLPAKAPRLFSVSDTSRDAFVAIDDPDSMIAGRLGEAPDLPPPKVRT